MKTAIGAARAKQARKEARKQASVMEPQSPGDASGFPTGETPGFPADDPLFLRVCKAYDATDALCMDLHYRSCASGVGKPAKEKPFTGPALIAPTDQESKPTS